MLARKEPAVEGSTYRDYFELIFHHANQDVTDDCEDRQRVKVANDLNRFVTRCFTTQGTVLVYPVFVVSMLCKDVEARF